MVTIAPMPAPHTVGPDLPGRWTLRGRPILQPVRAVELAPARAFFFNTAPIGDARIDLTAWGFLFRWSGNRAPLLMATNGPQSLHLSSSPAGSPGGL